MSEQILNSTATRRFLGGITPGQALPGKALTLDANGQNAIVGPVWIDDPVTRSRFPCGSCVMGDKLYGLQDNYVYSFDGLNTVKTGGSVLYGWNYLYTDGTRLYTAFTNSLYAKKTITGTVTGTFLQGETVTQATSNATGYLVKQNAGSIEVCYISGTWDNSHNCTGGTSAATVTAVSNLASIASRFFARANDAASPFRAVFEIAGFYNESFVDCGTVGGKHLLLMFAATDLTPGSEIATVYYNYPNDNSTWTALWSSVAGAVTHFHGASFITAVNGGATNILVAYSGDDTHTASICYCEDIADFIANPSTWKTRWGMDLTGASRSTYLNTGAGHAYSFGTQSLHPTFRPLALPTDVNKRYAFFIPDGTTTSNKLTRLDLVTKEVATLGVSLPTGSAGMRTANGTILLSTQAQYGASDWLGSNDGFFHLYAVNNTLDGLTELARWARAEVVAGTTPSTTVTYYGRMIEYPIGNTNLPSTIHIPTDRASQAMYPHPGTKVGKIVSKPSIIGGMDASNPKTFGEGDRPINFAINSKFNRLASDGSIADWTKAGDLSGTLAQETSIVDTERGAKYSVKFTPTAGCTYFLQQLDSNIIAALAGNWITITARMLLTVSDQSAGLVWHNVEQSADLVKTNITTWQTVQVECFVPATATTGSIDFLAGGVAGEIIYVSDVSLVIGSKRDSVPSNLPSLDQLTSPTVICTSAFIGGSTGVLATAVNGILTLTGKKASGNNENLTIDFETTANTVIVSSGTGVTTVKIAAGIDFYVNTACCLASNGTAYCTIAAITGSVKLSSTQATLTGAAGTATCSMPFQGTSYKKVVINLHGFTDHATPANNTYTYPTAFSYAPTVMGDATAMGVTATVSDVTKCVISGASVDTGVIILEGY